MSPTSRGAGEVSVAPSETQLIIRVDTQVKHADRDRWLATRFAALPARRRLVALLAFADEIARASWVTSEPMIGEIRLAWWREAVDEVYAAAAPDEVRQHDVVRAMAMAFPASAPRPDQSVLHAMIDARSTELDPPNYPDLDAIVAHVDATAGALAGASAACLGQEADGDETAPDEEALTAGLTAGLTAARHAGRAWGLVGMARSLSALAHKGRAPASQDVLDERGVNRAHLMHNQDKALGRAVVAPLLAQALEAHGAASNAVRRMDPVFWPALGYGALTRAYAKRLSASDVNPWLPQPAMSLLRRQLILTGASLRGRV